MRTLLLICLISAIFSAVTFDLEQVRKDLLTRHNYYRAKHQAPDLTRLAKLEEISQSYSEYLASIGYLVHSSNTLNGNYIGENLYMGYNAGYLGTSPVDSWYEEISKYSFAKSDYIKGTGHFTQVVWKNSKQLGCGVACGSNDYCYVTCNYYPGGNYLGEFRENVLPLSETSSEDTTSKEEDNEVKTDAPVKDVTTNGSGIEKLSRSILGKHNYLIFLLMILFYL